MSNPLLGITLRDATKEDLGYVIKSWLESYRNSPFGKNLSPKDYYRDQYDRMSKLIQDCKVTIACLTDDPDTICGFICFERTKENVNVVHYLYVKLLFRKDGLAKKLFDSTDPTIPTVCSHTNKIFQKMRVKLSLINEREYDTLLRFNKDPIQAYKHQQENKRKA